MSDKFKIPTNKRFLRVLLISTDPWLASNLQHGVAPLCKKVERVKDKDDLNLILQREVFDLVLVGGLEGSDLDFEKVMAKLAEAAPKIPLLWVHKDPDARPEGTDERPFALLDAPVKTPDFRSAVIALIQGEEVEDLPMAA